MAESEMTARITARHRNAALRQKFLFTASAALFAPH